MTICVGEDSAILPNIDTHQTNIEIYLAVTCDINPWKCDISVPGKRNTYKQIHTKSKLHMIIVLCFDIDLFQHTVFSVLGS